MFCLQCGTGLKEKRRSLNYFRCKTTCNAEKENYDEILTGNISSCSFSFKKHIRGVALFAVAIGVLCGISGCHSYNVESELEIAESYPSELDYEQAAAEFQNILENEPKNVEAYLGLAEAYVCIGKTNKAIKVLKEGYELTGDQRLQDMIDGLERGEEPSVSSSTVSSSDNTSNEPVESVYGSMGSVTVLGTQYDIATTTILDLSSKGLTNDDIKPVAQLVNLTYLNLTENQISDITPLSGLINLTELGLSNNEISDISPLKGLVNIEWINLSYNRLSDISVLANLTRIKYLYLERNQITDISPLEGLIHLKQLDLLYNEVSDISSLATLVNLTHLYLYGNDLIDDVSVLEKLVNLNELWLGTKTISEGALDRLKQSLPNCEIT